MTETPISNINLVEANKEGVSLNLELLNQTITSIEKNQELHGKIINSIIMNFFKLKNTYGSVDNFDQQAQLINNELQGLLKASQDNLDGNSNVRNATSGIPKPQVPEGKGKYGSVSHLANERAGDLQKEVDRIDGYVKSLDRGKI